MRSLLFAIILVVALAAIPVAYWVGKEGWPGSTNADSASGDDKSATSAPSSVYAEGRLRPADGLLEIALIPGDQIADVAVNVGDPVTKDQVLATTTRQPLAQLQLDLAVAARDEAKQQQAQRLIAADAELLEAKAKLKQLQLEASAIAENESMPPVVERKLAQARDKLARLKSFASQPGTGPVVSPQELEEQQLEVESLEDELKRRREAVKTSIESAKAAIAQAEKARELIEETSLVSFDVQVELARTQLEQTVIKAPRDGDVLKIFVEAGERASTQPLLVMASRDKMTCVAEVFQSSMRFVKRGQSVVITSPALPKELRGKVSRIDRLVGDAQLANPNPLSPKDKKTADVYIELDKKSIDVARELVNLQVTVEIKLGSNPATASN